MDDTYGGKDVGEQKAKWGKHHMASDSPISLALTLAPSHWLAWDLLEPQ